MRNTDLPEFTRLLSDFLIGYGKPRPDHETLAFWFKILAPFSPSTIGKAFTAYASERPDFPPAPNGIAARCRLMDGRPDENEAWAIALSSRDERDSVMWTTEIQEAFILCRTVLNAGDEIGARMAFKDAYTRLVLAARIAGKPVTWAVSEGWDTERRQLVVARAVHAGLLASAPEHLALEYEAGEADKADAADGRPEGLQRVLEAVAQLEDPFEKADRLREERLQQEDDADRERRAEIDRQTKEYLKLHPEARYGDLLMKKK